MTRRLLNLLTLLSLVLCVATAACWLTGAVHATAWPCRARSERTWFIRFERQHLIVWDQQMVPQRLYWT